LHFLLNDLHFANGAHGPDVPCCHPVVLPQLECGSGSLCINPGTGLDRVSRDGDPRSLSSAVAYPDIRLATPQLTAGAPGAGVAGDTASSSLGGWRTPVSVHSSRHDSFAIMGEWQSLAVGFPFPAA